MSLKKAAKLTQKKRATRLLEIEKEIAKLEKAQSELLASCTHKDKGGKEALAYSSVTQALYCAISDLVLRDAT